jgi:pimeloyl-ACP methyl ester carboxylesterase
MQNILMILSGNLRSILKAGAFTSVMAVFLFLSGCATPVGVRYLDRQEAGRQLTASVLSDNTLSSSTKQILNRSGKAGKFNSSPEQVIADIHKGLPTAKESDRFFALAELSFLHASTSGNRHYYLSSAIYAYAFLFPKDITASPDPFDPRFRLAVDLYNQGIARGLKQESGVNVILKDGVYRTSFGEVIIAVDFNNFIWGEFRLVDFIDASKLGVRGIRNRYEWHGMGAPLVASLERLPGIHDMAFAKVPPGLKVPATALLRIDNVENGLKTGLVTGQLELITHGDKQYTNLEGRTVPIEFGYSAALAYSLEGSQAYSIELKGLFSGDLQIFKDQARFRDNVFLMAPYRKGRIPLVLVHGTASSPARWAEMVNELLNDRELAGKYQVWLFTYNTGNPILYSGGILTEGLKNTVKELDPEGEDPAMKKMVVIGHSQGGLLTKLTVVDSGNRFWNNLTSTTLDDLDVLPETKALLKRSLFYEQLPFVKRVIFISTPQYGSYISGGWIGKFAGKLITLPGKIISPIGEVLAKDPDVAARFSIKDVPKSTDNMDPKNRFIKAIASLPIAPGVIAHSIIPVQNPDDPKEKWNDGVVAYKSAHIDGVASELIIPNSGHSAQDAPEAIEEVRRILIENLKEP